MVQKIGIKIGMITSGVAIVLLLSPLAAMAQEAAAQAAAGGNGALRAGLTALAANLGVGIAAVGSALGQGRATAAAMESIGRNPNSAGAIFTPLLLGLALMEALTLYALLIAFLLQSKV